jgi:hypothetical protein
MRYPLILLSLVFLPLASSPAHAGLFDEFMNSCMNLMLSTQEQAKLLNELLSSATKKIPDADLKKMLAEAAEKIKARPGSMDVELSMKLAFLKSARENAYRFNDQEIFPALDAVIRTSKDPVNRLAAVKFLSMSGKKQMNQKISDEAMEVLWADFESGSRDHQEHLLISMVTVDLSPAALGRAMTQFYGLSASGDGLIRILASLNILAREAHDRISPEILSSAFPGTLYLYENLRKQVPSSFFMGELIRGYGTLYLREKLINRFVFMKTDIEHLMKDARSSDPYIAALIERVFSR